ncbi:hypothetical protein BYT27DRAFT_7189580 [Phlegmacium glaucopus]|nr:hypothetical protein BYT27DRAFT_7189580 [Phlegmacium glaucopus]
MDTLGHHSLEQSPENFRGSRPSGETYSFLALHKNDYAIGIGLLLIVVLLWTSSSFLTQDLYEGGYNKPFMVTYLNTSAFSLYLLPFLLRYWWKRNHQFSKPQGIADQYQAIATEVDEVLEQSEARPNASDDPQVLLQEAALPPLTTKQTVQLAFGFCLLWFIANWSLNVALELTSVASATILSTMSGFFTLGIGRLFRVEKLSLIKICTVVTSFIGVILVSSSDSPSKQPAHLNPHVLVPAGTVSHVILGNALSLISALFYAMYVILLKVRIKAEYRIDMQLFFGFVGLFNILCCWPLGLILHLTGAEIFELPHTKQAVYAIIINMAITLSSDYFYALAMLKTTPLVVTVGLSLTIPIAVVGDFIRNRPTHGIVIVGASLVVVSFMALGWENSKVQKGTTREEL